MRKLRNALLLLIGGVLLLEALLQLASLVLTNVADRSGAGTLAGDTIRILRVGDSHA